MKMSYLQDEIMKKKKKNVMLYYTLKYNIEKEEDSKIFWSF